MTKVYVVIARPFEVDEAKMKLMASMFKGNEEGAYQLRDYWALRWFFTQEYRWFLENNIPFVYHGATQDGIRRPTEYRLALPRGRQYDAARIKMRLAFQMEELGRKSTYTSTDRRRFRKAERISKLIAPELHFV